MTSGAQIALLLRNNWLDFEGVWDLEFLTLPAETTRFGVLRGQNKIFQF